MYCDTSTGGGFCYSIYSNTVVFDGDMDGNCWGRDGGGGYNVLTGMPLIYRLVKVVTEAPI